MDNMIEALTPIFQDILELEDLVLFPKMTANDIGAWDSLAHICLMVAIEREFSVKFSTSEISNLADVGTLAQLVIEKVGAATA